MDKTVPISDPFYETAYALHFSLGAAELARNLVLTADLVWRRSSQLHIWTNGVDYNRFNSAQGPDSRCSPAQRNDVTAMCSNGQITSITPPASPSTKGCSCAWKALLVRARSSASYKKAATRERTARVVITPGTGFNNQLVESNGPLPTDLRHILNLPVLLTCPGDFKSLSAFPPTAGLFWST
jgi:hypothetical protein